MNRTRLAQLAAVLGAAVLLVLAVAVTRTDLGTDSTTVAGPAMDPVGTGAPAEPGPTDGSDEQASAVGGDGPAPGQPGDTPVMGPTASAPTDGEPSGDPAPAPPGPDGDGAAGDPATAPTDDRGTLPQEPRDPFAPGTAGATSGPSTTTPPDDAAAGGPVLAGGSTAEPPDVPATEAAGPRAETPAAGPPDVPATEAPQPTASAPAAGPSAEPSVPESPAADLPPGGTTTGPTESDEDQPQAELDTVPSATHHVVPGDNLWDIAEAALGQGANDADVAVAVDQLYELNRDVIGGDPDLILPGQVFDLPDW